MSVMSMLSPASPASFSTTILSPAVTRYCLPPVRTTANIGSLLLQNWTRGRVQTPARKAAAYGRGERVSTATGALQACCCVATVSRQNSDCRCEAIVERLFLAFPAAKPDKARVAWRNRHETRRTHLAFRHAQPSCVHRAGLFPGQPGSGSNAAGPGPGGKPRRADDHRHRYPSRGP